MSIPPTPDGEQAIDTGIPEIDYEIVYAGRTMDRVRSLCADFDIRMDAGICPEVTPACAQELQDVLSDLMQYLVEHFVTEERLMKDVAFPHREPDLYGRHVEDHANIMEEAARLIVELERLPTVATLRGLYRLMESWTLRHISEFDLTFAAAGHG